MKRVFGLLSCYKNKSIKPGKDEDGDMTSTGADIDGVGAAGSCYDGRSETSSQPPADTRRKEISGNETAGRGEVPDPEEISSEDGEFDANAVMISLVRSATFRSLPELTFHGGAEALGQSSNNPETNADITYCRICMEEKHSSECMAVRGCGHKYCTYCLGQYVKLKLEFNEISVRCPYNPCREGFVDPELCRSILPPKDLELWSARLCEEAIPALEKLYCPYRDCSALLIDDGVCDGKAIEKSDCPHCRRAMCARCRSPWHAGLKCDEYQRSGNDEGLREEKMMVQLAKKSEWRRCPHCRFYVEKISGCNYVQCRCRQEFCYNCSQPVRGTHSCVTCD